MSMEVRRIRAHEWAELRALRLAALQDVPDAFTATFEEESGLPTHTWERWARSSADGGPSFVALALDADTGVLGGLAGGRPHDELDDANHLFSMWVDPRARHGGVGRRLVEAVIGWSGSTDRPRLLLRVSESNEAALTLYRSCGFVPTDERVPLRPGSETWTVTMELRP